jgi:hypothetical protein
MIRVIGCWGEGWEREGGYLPQKKTEKKFKKCQKK